MAEMFRVLNSWTIEDFHDASPAHLRTLNAISPDGIRYVPEYAQGGSDRIELQEYVTDRDTETGDHVQDAGGPGASY